MTGQFEHATKEQIEEAWGLVRLNLLRAGELVACLKQAQWEGAPIDGKHFPVDREAVRAMEGLGQLAEAFDVPKTKPQGGDDAPF